MLDLIRAAASTQPLCRFSKLWRNHPMSYFLVTYDGPTDQDERDIMGAIESTADDSFNICYKTYMVKTNMTASQLAQFFRSQLAAKGKVLGDNDSLVIAE